MKKENVLVVLWIIFGFMFISGIDAILYFITYSIYFIKAELGISYGIMKFSMPITALFLYILTTFLIFKKIKHQSFQLTQFPKKTLVILALITLVLNPITNKLSGLYAEHETMRGKVVSSDFFQFFGWMDIGINIARWLVLIILTILFVKQLRLIETKN